MTEEQRECVWNCLSYRVLTNSNLAEVVTTAVSLGCQNFGFEPNRDFEGTRASAMYSVAVYYKTPKDIFPRKIYIGNEVGPLAETFSVTSEEIMELVALYDL